MGLNFNSVDEEKAYHRQEIESLRKKLKARGLSQDAREELQDQLDTAREDLAAVVEQEKLDQDDRIDRLMDDFGPYGIHDRIRKPTKAQIKACIAALDQQYPQWETTSPDALAATLIENFPDLLKKPKAKPKKRRNGLAIVLVIIAIICWYMITRQ